MKNEAKTINVESYFGTKDLTREEFKKRWTDHMKEIRKLSYTQNWQIACDEIIMKVAEQASKEFDITYAAQTK